MFVFMYVWGFWLCWCFFVWRQFCLLKRTNKMHGGCILFVLVPNKKTKKNQTCWGVIRASLLSVTPAVDLLVYLDFYLMWCNALIYVARHCCSCVKYYYFIIEALKFPVQIQKYSLSNRSIQRRSSILMARSLCGTPRRVSPFPVTWSALLVSCPVRLVLEMRRLIPLSTSWLLWVRWTRIQQWTC